MIDVDNKDVQPIPEEQEDQMVMFDDEGNPIELTAE